MVAINSTPVFQAGDNVTVFETTVGTTLTDFTFPSVQETTFVFNEGVERLTVIASSQIYHVKPNQEIRITDNITTLQIKSDAGTQPFKITGRANGNSVVIGGQSDLEVSIMSYGADPAGVQDSLSAFNSALATNKEVYVPAGTYKITGTIVIPRKVTLRLSSNAIIKPSGDFNVIQLKPECKLIGGIIDTQGVSSFTKACIYANGQDTFQPYAHLTIVRDVNMLGKDYEGVAGATSTSWTGKGIHFYSGNSDSAAYGNGAYIAYIQVSNVNITNFYRGIYLEREKAPANGNPWITSCTFDQIGMMNCQRSIDITSNNAFYQAGHTFTNLQFQANNYTERYIYCEGSNNLFQGVFWDIEAYFTPRNVVPFEFGTISYENYIEGTQNYLPDTHYIDKNNNMMKPNSIRGLVNPVNILFPKVTNQVRNFIGDQDDILAGASKAYTVTKLSSHTIANGSVDSPFQPNKGTFLGLTGVDEANYAVIELDFGTTPISEMDLIGFVFRGGQEIPQYIKVERVTANGGAYATVNEISNNTAPYYYFSTYAANTYKLKFTFGSSTDAGVNRKIRIYRIFATSIGGVGKAWLNAAEGGTVYGDVSFKGYIQVSNVAALPTASATYRGKMVRVEGAAGAADTVYVCMKSATDTYSWKAIISG